MAEYYAVSETLILKKRGINQERSELTYNHYVAKTGVKEFWIQRYETYGEFVAKETLDIVSTLSNGATVADVNIL
jgi:hypothetical protein